MIEMEDLELAAKQVGDSLDFYKQIVNKRAHEDTGSLWKTFIKQQNQKVIDFWEGNKG
jgi:rubrerythrin